MILQDYTNNLPKDKQFNLAIRLTKLAIPIWDNYANKNALTYRDTVVGLTHAVDKHLLLNTIDTVEKHLQINKSDNKLYNIRRQYADPVVALQDFDWELPEEVQATFYSVYNLLEASLGKVRTTFNELTIYVSINQAVNALMTSKMITIDEINNILDDIKNFG